ncbi:unnamed protein product [Closterium sp. NIES-64]|nr:unnamed protein product [Closterium sp. NIES-64]CAI5946254.1 unnamed protein product [Closterium sp. NIES-64]
MAESPSSPLTAASRLCKNKRSSSKCNVAAEAVVAGLEVTAAAAAAADAARDGQWLASGFEELQNKLEAFSVTTQQLAVSLEEARKEARESREAIDAARAERDLLVVEMEATLAAWSTSDAEKAEELARVEAEKIRAEMENGELKLSPCLVIAPPTSALGTRASLPSLLIKRKKIAAMAAAALVLLEAVSAAVPALAALLPESPGVS